MLQKIKNAIFFLIKSVADLELNVVFYKNKQLTLQKMKIRIKAEKLKQQTLSQ